MVTNAQWTVVMDDKKIINHNIKNSEGFSTAYKILDDDAFWNQDKFQTFGLFNMEHLRLQIQSSIEIKLHIALGKMQT